MYSVLQNRENIKFRFEKFPYLIIDDALPSDLYNKLSDCFPKYEKIIGNNEYKEILRIDIMPIILLKIMI